jgi:serine/threonine protein kinase
LSAQPPSRARNKPSKTFSREYQVSSCLGKGGYGQAFNGRRKLDNKTVAIKFLPKDRILNWGIYEGVRINLWLISK